MRLRLFPKPSPTSQAATSPSRKPVAVAVTGGIGAGKSEALKAFARHGAATISSDEIVHELLRSNPDVHAAVRERWGQALLDDDGGVDRARVAEVVFGDRKELTWLESLLHPRVIATYLAWRERLGEDVPVLLTSSATRLGLDALAAELLHRVPLEAPRPAEALAAEEELAEHRTFRPAADRGWNVERLSEGGFRVTGEPVERLLARHDLENDEALAHVEHRLHRMGVVRALEAAGFEPGDDVEIGGVVFELDP